MKSSPLAFLSGAVEKLNNFLENRDEKQKHFIVGLLFVVVLLADFFILIRPVIYVFTQTVPQLSAQKLALDSLRDDMKNKETIGKRWEVVREKFAETQKQFIPQSEVSSLLESLSKLAQESQVKIITLKPLETSDAGSGLLRIPIRMSAVAGTHDLGSFLAYLEGGRTYFKVTDMKISTNVMDEHRHVIELSIETYAKTK